MLVLARKKGESIIIDHDISISVLSIEGDVVRIGIHAPMERTIHRKEIYEIIQKANAEAVSQTEVLADLSMLKSTPNVSNKIRIKDNKRS